MDTETGERDDEVTVDETGTIVNYLGEPVQLEQAAKERASYEAWRKNAGGDNGLHNKQ